MNRLKNYIITISIVMLLLGAVLVALYLLFDLNVLAMGLVYGVCVIVLIVTFVVVIKWRHEADHYSSVQLDASIDDALKLASVGMVVYNDNHEITWASAMFKERGLDVSGQKLLAWIPELNELMSGDLEEVTVIINEHKYEVVKKEDAAVLFFKDISENYDLKRKMHDQAMVLGLINFDNLDEISSDDDISKDSNDIKATVFSYLKSHGVTYKTLRNRRIIMILTEAIYQKLKDDRFSVLSEVRKQAKEANMPVTLSMSFARGSDDIKELDEQAQALLDLALTRGGDQVASRKIGEEVVYYGGASEAKEKSSKVQARVMINTLKDLILRSSNVIICEHLDADADCVGSAIAMSDIVQSFKKEAYIIYKTGGVERGVASAIESERKLFEERHHLVSINEAMNHLNNDTLVLMVDHHSAQQSNGKDLIKQARRVVIIDHHRRMADLDTSPILTYIEASASSTCELVLEFFPYLMGRVSIAPVEASLMYLGILIDTNRFRVRTGVRTFEVLKTLRQYGADPSLVERFNEEPYDLVIKRSKLIRSSYVYKEGIVIAKDEDIYPRSIISQASDAILDTLEVRAVFVIAKTDKDEAAISARSKGDFNVQMVMEKLNGGGHMTAAGLQVKDRSVSELEKMLIVAIEDYMKGETK